MYGNDNSITYSLKMVYSARVFATAFPTYLYTILKNVSVMFRTIVIQNKLKVYIATNAHAFTHTCLDATQKMNETATRTRERVKARKRERERFLSEITIGTKSIH